MVGLLWAKINERLFCLGKENRRLFWLGNRSLLRFLLNLVASELVFFFFGGGSFLLLLVSGTD